MSTTAEFSPSEGAGPREAAPEGLPSLSARVRRGALWSSLSTLVLRLTNIFITAVVAHILTPRDFGVFAVALTAFTIIANLGELGVASCLIRADLDIDALAPTMVTISLATGAIFAGAMALAAPQIATALGSSAGTGPVRVMALTVFLNGVFAVPYGQLSRDFKQDKLFLANAISLIPSTAVLLFLAKTGNGAMAFAWSRVIAQFVMGCVIFASVPKHYKPGFARWPVSVLFSFGLPLAAANFVNYILLNVDYAFVGHLIGIVALGIYMLAFTLASAPTFLLGNVINSIAMPAFSRVKHDPDLLRKALASALRVVSLILMPMCALMIALARPIVLVLYGARWAAAAEVLAILSTYGAISIICVLFANMLTSLGKAKLTLVIQLLWLGALVPAMALGVHRNGIVGAAVAHIAVIGPLVLPMYLLVLKRATGIRLITLGKAILPPLLAASVAALAARAMTSQFTSPLAQLVTGLAVGGLVYVVAAAPQAAAFLSQEQAAKLRETRIFRSYGTVARLAGLRVSSGPEHGGEDDGHQELRVADVRQTESVAATLTQPAASEGQTAERGRDLAVAATQASAVSGPPAQHSYESSFHGRANQRGDVMNSSVTAVPAGRTSPRVAPAATRVAPAATRERERAMAKRERATLRRVGIAWGLLVVNAIIYYGSALHIPSAAGKLITQGALPAALIVALTVNRRVIFRPNVFLCLVSLLVIEAIIPSLQPHYFGTVYRTFRAAEFVTVLWLLTPWWGRRDLALVRYHLTALWVALGTVVLGLLLMPGRALGGGRLSGVLWVIPATEVGHYSAVVIGLAVVLWFGGLLSGRVTAFVCAFGGTLILLAHTRTALLAMVAALLVAGLSLIAARARVRKVFVIAGVVLSIGIMTAAGVATAWLTRGQDTQQLASLTGRTDFWTLVLELPRSKFQEIFGFGLSNGSVDGLPIDSNWLVAYLQQGLFGVIISAAMPLFLLVVAFFRPRSIKRALALFLITYCLVASFTQVGFSNDTTYLLELTLAASLLVPAISGTGPASLLVRHPDHSRRLSRSRQTRQRAVQR